MHVQPTRYVQALRWRSQKARTVVGEVEVERATSVVELGCSMILSRSGVATWENLQLNHHMSALLLTADDCSPLHRELPGSPGLEDFTIHGPACKSSFPCALTL
jgi:hypothetical protein